MNQLYEQWQKPSVPMKSIVSHAIMRRRASETMKNIVLCIASIRTSINKIRQKPVAGTLFVSK